MNEQDQQMFEDFRQAYRRGLPPEALEGIVKNLAAIAAEDNVLQDGAVAVQAAAELREWRRLLDEIQHDESTADGKQQRT